MKKHNNISFMHETIQYKWEDVPDEKYANWLKMLRTDNLDTADFSVSGFPYMLQIEPTNFCNLSCPLCPAGRKSELNRKRRHMSFKEFKSIIDDMQKYLLFVVLWEWGEPFLNPELPEMIQYASEKGIKVITSTNAQLLENKNYVERTLRSGLATLIIAIDSLKSENYLKYRKGGNLDKAISGLENIILLKKQLNSKVLINLRMVIMKSNENELPEMRKFAKRMKVDKFTVKTVNPSCGLISMDHECVPENPLYRRYAYKPESYERIRINGLCIKVNQMSSIFSNGDVVPCCYDYNSEMKIGNINKTPLTELWNGNAYRELRKIIHYAKDRFPKCKECGINYELSKASSISDSWFPEAHDSNIGAIKRINNYTKNIVKLFSARKVL